MPILVSSFIFFIIDGAILSNVLAHAEDLGGNLSKSLDEEADIESELDAQENSVKNEAAPNKADKTLEDEFSESPDEITKDAKAEDFGEEPIEPEKIEQAEAPVEEPTEITEAPKQEVVEPAVEPELLKAETESPINDEPNLNYEAKLHDIYKNYYSTQVPEDKWNELIQSKSAEQYRIQKDDNLWDISKTLFGDGNYWPKVWSLNSKIQNPHIISTNNTIQFVLGDIANPPAFNVTENSDSSIDSEGKISKMKITHTKVKSVEGAVVEGDVAGSSTTEEPEPEIPAPLKVSKPVLKNMPTSFPEWQNPLEEGKFDELGFSYERRKILDIENSLFLSSYISEDEPEFIGTVSEIESGGRITSSYQYIYVSMNKGTAQPGETLLVIANRGRVQSVNEVVKGFLGYGIDVQGEIKLIEQVQSIDNDSDIDTFRALVLKTVNPVTVGGLIIRDKIEKVKITDQGRKLKIAAQIIGGGYFSRRLVYADESIAYLNKGAEDGVLVGDILSIHANMFVRNPDSRIDSHIVPVGLMRIVRTTPHFSTAIVVKSASSILTGDVTSVTYDHNQEVLERPTSQSLRKSRRLDDEPVTK